MQERKEEEESQLSLPALALSILEELREGCLGWDCDDALVRCARGELAELGTLGGAGPAAVASAVDPAPAPAPAVAGLTLVGLPPLRLARKAARFDCQSLELFALFGGSAGEGLRLLSPAPISSAPAGTAAVVSTAAAAAVSKDEGPLNPS